MFATLLLTAMASGPDASVDFFKPSGPVLTIRIEVDKENLAILLKDRRKTVHSTVRWNDQVLNDCGLHLKGAAGSSREWGDKPALTLNSDKFKKNQTFFSMDKWHLNNSVQDGNYINEILFSDLFRNAGVPTARATHALVELNGKKKGLYVLKEGYDKTFLARWFKDTTGNLYDGGFLTDIDQNLQLDHGIMDDKAIKALAAAARIEDHKKRLEELDKRLDLDKFYSLWAIEVMGCDWDGYTRTRNNYRLYHNPETGKFVFFAHGKDQMFQNVNDGLVHGWGGLIARRLWETEEGRKKYIAKCKDVLEKQFTTEKLHKIIDDWTLRLKDPMNNFEKGLGDRYLKEIKNYKNAVKARVEYLQREVPKLKP